MRAILQRVTSASVSVDGTQVGQCGPGLMILICAMQGDTEENAEQLAAKISKVRIFKDLDGKMNRSILDIGGSALVISQFTLAADTSRGNRPGFSAAAAPDLGERLYSHFVNALKKNGISVETGTFGADMAVTLTNDGPVTLQMER